MKKILLILVLTFITCTSSALAESPALPLDVFGIEIGNRRTYQGTNQQGTYTSASEVIAIDATTFPETTYVVEAQQDGEIDKGWYRKSSEELWLMGIQEVATNEFITFFDGLFEAWNPMRVGEQRYASTVTGSSLFPGIMVNTSLAVEVLAQEPVELNFDTLEAFKTRNQLRMWFDGYEETVTFHQWVVPYLGVVKYQDQTSVELLTGFAIAGGSITEMTDLDGDGLKDYQEILIYATNWEDLDTDDDSFSDGEEIEAGTDPNDPMSHPTRPIPGALFLLLQNKR